MNYVIITPARDEEAYIERMMQAVIRQTVLPQQWVIVDDGSSDRTGDIIDECAKGYPWITVVHRANRGSRQAGRGVVDTFYDGYGELVRGDWEFIVKLDADLTLRSDYFERCFSKFAADSLLGIAGGGVYHAQGGSLKLEVGPSFHVRGATKIYRRRCWDDIGGILRAVGWDTIDEVKANMLGWRTRTFPEISVLHHRFTGSMYGLWKDCVKNGRANYFAGYHPAFMLVKFVRRLLVRPYIRGAFGLMWGFLGGYIRKSPRVADHALVRYTRAQQIRRLLLMETMWK